MSLSTAVTLLMLLSISTRLPPAPPLALGDLIPISARDFPGLSRLPLRGLTLGRVLNQARQRTATDACATDFFAQDSSNAVTFWAHIDENFLGLEGACSNPTATIREIWITEVSSSRVTPRHLTERALASARQRGEFCRLTANLHASSLDPDASETVCQMQGGIRLYFEFRPACRSGALRAECVAARTRIVLAEDAHIPFKGSFKGSESLNLSRSLNRSPPPL
jgi:hypothetical protein